MAIAARMPLWFAAATAVMLVGSLGQARSRGAADAISAAPGRAVPASSVASQAERTFFPIGVMEDALVTNGETPERFEAMILDLKSRGLDTVLYANNWVERD